MNSIRRELHSRGMCSVCIFELVKLASATECHSLGRKGNRRKWSSDQALCTSAIDLECDPQSIVSLMYQSRVCRCLRPPMAHA